jgi:4-nitrophenyl phosphatase
VIRAHASSFMRWARIIRPMPLAPLAGARLVIFDLDGVVYRGDVVVRGAPQLIAALRSDGRTVRFATNNSMAARSDYVTRLASHGIESREVEIVTSTSATVAHLGHHLPDARSVLAVGAAGMLTELRSAGYEALPADEAAPREWNGGPLPRAWDVVVAGLDPAFDYRRMGIAAAAIRSGAAFIATNADLRYPTPDGFVPGAGTIVAALAAASGVRPRVIGKPEPTMFQEILAAAGTVADDAVVIGDNPDADMPAARQAGIRSILVLTGVADGPIAAALEGDRRPDHGVDGPMGVAELLGVSLS